MPATPPVSVHCRPMTSLPAGTFTVVDVFQSDKVPYCTPSIYIISESSHVAVRFKATNQNEGQRYLQ